MLTWYLPRKFHQKAYADIYASTFGGKMKQRLKSKKGFSTNKETAI